MIALISTILPISIGVGVGYLVIRVATRRSELVKEQFKILADALDCEATIPEKSFMKFTKSFPRIDGQIDEKGFYAHMYTVGSGKNQRTYTAFRIKTTNRYSYTFNIYQERFFSKIGKGLGMQDIEIGDKEFDDNFMIKSNDDYFIQSILDEALKSHFLQVYDQLKGQFSLESDEVIYSEMMYMANKHKRAAFEQLIYLGSAISDAVTRFSESHKPPGL